MEQEILGAVRTGVCLLSFLFSPMSTWFMVAFGATVPEMSFSCFSGPCATGHVSDLQRVAGVDHETPQKPPETMAVTQRAQAPRNVACSWMVRVSRPVAASFFLVLHPGGQEPWCQSGAGMSRPGGEGGRLAAPLDGFRWRSLWFGLPVEKGLILGRR